MEVQRRCKHCGRMFGKRADVYIGLNTEESLGCGGCLEVTHPTKTSKCPICGVTISKDEYALCKKVERHALHSTNINRQQLPVACVNCYTLVRAKDMLPEIFPGQEGVEWY